MEWFGWLTKGKCEISLLDILIMMAEIGSVAVIYILVTSRKARK